MDESDDWGGRVGELTLQDYFAIFLRRKWLVVAIVAASLIGVTAWNLLATPTYESTASILLRTNNNEQLFPSVPNAQRTDFNRRVVAEFDFTSTTAFARTANEATPDDVTVVPRIDSDAVNNNANNSTSTLEFVARANDAELARLGAAAWADTYLEVRRSTAVDRIAFSILDTETQIGALELQKAEILEPLAPIEAALQTETDSDTISRLTTQRLSLTQSLEDELLPVTIQLRDLSQNLARLRIAESLVARDNISELLSQEAAEGRQVAPNRVRNTALAGVLGVLLAAGAALIAESLTATIRSSEDLSRLAPTIPVLAQIPDLPKDTSAHELAYRNGSVYAEAVERLVSAVLYQRVGRPGDRMKILVTSALPGEGKTTVAANLARRLSLTAVRTLVVDADLRRPKLHNELGIPRQAGLSELLARGVALEQHFIPLPSGSNVRILGAGSSTDQAATLLRQQFRPAIERLPMSYELLIVDAPPVLAVTDAEVLVDTVDVVLLVVRANSTKTSQLTQAIRQLTALGATVAGFVLVGVRDEDTANYSYAYAGPETAAMSASGSESNGLPASTQTRSTTAAPTQRNGSERSTRRPTAQAAQASRRAQAFTNEATPSGTSRRRQRRLPRSKT